MAGRRKPAAAGHNFAEVLQATYGRVISLNEQIAALNKQKSQAYQEARAAGVDLKVFGVVLSRTQQDRADVLERDAAIADYERILFGATAIEPEEGG